MSLTTYNAPRPSCRAIANSITAALGGVSPSFECYITFAPGDYLVFLIVANSTPSTPNTVVETNSGLSFTQLGTTQNDVSLWICKNTTTSTYTVLDIDVTWSATQNFICVATVVTDTSGYDAAIKQSSGSSGTTALQNVNVGYNGAGNSVPGSLSLAFWGMTKPNTNPTQSLTLVQAPNGLGAIQREAQVTGSPVNFAAFLATSDGEEAYLSEDLGVPAGIADTATGINIWGAFSLVFLPSTISLDDNTYKIDGGPLLNNPANTYPLFDIDTVQGLSDLTADSSTDSIDGTDGSYVSARYVTGKTIIIDGIVYALGVLNEDTIASLRTAMRPNLINPALVTNQGTKPLYWKPAGKDPRKIGVFPTSFKCDIDRNRAIGQAPFELQMLTADAFAESLALNTVAFTTSESNGSVLKSAIQAGDAESYPVIYFNIGFSPSTGTISFWNLTWATQYTNFYSSYTGTYADTGIGIAVGTGGLTDAGQYKLDFKNRTLERFTPSGPVDVSSAITVRNWWSILPGTINKLGCNNGGGALVAFADRWT